MEQEPTPWEPRADATLRLTQVLAACLAIATLSLLLPSATDMDPYMWATWAREILHLRLSTEGGPAWKPLPVLVHFVFTPFGSAAPRMWLVVARAGACLAVAMAYRLARRLADWCAGAIAAGGLVLSPSFLEYLAPWGMSEPLLAGLVLLAVERHLDIKYDQAYGLIFLAMLLRVELLPFFLGYSAFLWIRLPRSRRWIVASILVVPVLWLLPDYLSSGSWLRSASRAQIPSQGGPLLSSHPATVVLENSFSAVLMPVAVGAAVGSGFALVAYLKWRREQALVGLFLLCVGWLAVVAATTQARLSSGEQRYLIVSTVGFCVLGGVGWIRFAGWVASAIARRTEVVVKPWTRFGVIALLSVGAAPFVVSRLETFSSNAGEMPYQAHKYRELPIAIQRAGGRERVLACGPITTDPYKVPALAWHLRVHQSLILSEVRPTGTVFRTPPFRGTPPLPSRLGSSEFRLIATTDQWEVMSTCKRPWSGRER